MLSLLQLSRVTDKTSTKALNSGSAFRSILLACSKSQIFRAPDIEPATTISSAFPNLTDSTALVCPERLYKQTPFDYHCSVHYSESNVRKSSQSISFDSFTFPFLASILAHRIKQGLSP